MTKDFFDSDFDVTPVKPEEFNVPEDNEELTEGDLIVYADDEEVNEILEDPIKKPPRKKYKEKYHFIQCKVTPEEYREFNIKIAMLGDVRKDDFVRSAIMKEVRRREIELVEED